MSSDEEEEELEFLDDYYYSDDYDDDDSLDDFGDEEEEEEEEEDSTQQPIHFRECLRLLDAALTSNNPPILPRWCTSEHINILEDPMLLIHGHEKCLSLPMNKKDVRRFIRHAEPLDMIIDIVDGISFPSSAHQIPANAFSILNQRWSTKIEPYLKRSCIGPALQLDHNQLDIKVSNLVLLEPCQFPRQFHWSVEQQHSGTIAKLFLSLPSIYKGGKETIVHYKEKHVFELLSNTYTIVPTSSECKHEIDFISHGYKLVLVYDIIPMTPTIFYNVDINEATLTRVGRVLETWMNGLEHEYHSYSSKIIVPFSDTFHVGHNPLLHGIDRVIGTVLRRTIEHHYSEHFLLYQGLIQPNRSNDGTVHACRLLTDLKLMSSNNGNMSTTLFNQIDLCLGNCNETYSGNVFVRKTRSEQGQLVSLEQFTVPIWCLVPMNEKYNLLIDNIPRVLSHLEQNLLPHHQHHQTEIFLLIDWLLTTTKKINFNTKSLLHHLLRLSTDPTITHHFSMIIRQLLEHKKFHDQFFPMILKQEYDDIVYLLNYSKDDKIQLYIHQVFQTVLKRRSRDSERIRDAIKFIGTLSTRNIDPSFLLVLTHELLSNVLKPNSPKLSMTDLSNLLALLSISMDSYELSCQIISQQIIQQIKITTTAMTISSTITNLLRTVLVPTLIQIYRQFADTNYFYGKRKRDSTVYFPPWFLSLYRTCLTLLNAYCNSSPAIPTYDNLSNVLHTHCSCSVCEQLFVFLQNSKLFEQTFLISNDKIYHFNMTVNTFTPLFITAKPMTSDKCNHQIHIMKMSTYDEEIWRENILLRSLLAHIQLSNSSEDQCEMAKTNSKRFKSS
ncbi:unnamed protein product [Adineta ricciae]|uniref:Uncharacterized protein n=2 Tax=Adineta ricciae TaxID=249248 RepID=A0A815Q6G8_ADIRI|nr:unnamed protein product [Adineta ricciae]